MKKYRHIISKVIPGSIAEEMEIEPGDELLQINDQDIEDVFDYRFLINDTYIEVLIRKADGEEWILDIDKDYDEDLGIEFENGLMDDYRSCHNKCIFCFIDQMPPGMRDTLYFKDDDSRLSFLQGNYITLTNMKDKDINRIIRYHLAPINISVQTTNPELRCKMLSNRFAGEALKKIDVLYEAGIEMNGQIVLCKGVNDGEELERTISDLAKYAPCMQSVSVVPVGLSKYRDGLYPLEPFTKEDAIKVIDCIESWQRKIYAEHEIHFIHASDEWYLLAERPFPDEDTYDGYIQLENGVGMMRLLDEEVKEALKSCNDDSACRDNKCHEISLATGKLAAPLIKDIADRVMKLYKNVKIHVYDIRNDFFGESITVAGLITGQDIIAQLKDKPLGSKLLLPKAMFKADADIFLDDVTKEDVEKALQIKVDIVKSSGQDLIDAMLQQETSGKKSRDGGHYEL
ncbi:MAG: DUF512 domain-containing protein [Lachnospiraceae bacterium]|nr:DUF512 domain-containing protein [Lachnospiraceae bacterium]